MTHWLEMAVAAGALALAIKKLPQMSHDAEVKALQSLFSTGAPEDQEAIKAIFGVLVKWAEKKFGTGAGQDKLQAVTMLASKALPWLPQDKVRALIEAEVASLDQGAQDALN